MNTLTDVCEWLSVAAPEICVKGRPYSYILLPVGNWIVMQSSQTISDYAATEYALRELAKQKDLDFSIESEGHEVRAAVLHPSGDGIAYIDEHAAIALAKALREVVEAS